MVTCTSPLVAVGDATAVAFVQVLLTVEQKSVALIGLVSLETLALTYVIGVLTSADRVAGAEFPRGGERREVCRTLLVAERGAAACPRSTRSAAKPIITTRVSVRKTAAAPRSDSRRVSPTVAPVDRHCSYRAEPVLFSVTPSVEKIRLIF